MTSPVDTLYQPNQLLNWMYLALTDQPLHQHSGHISPNIFSATDPTNKNANDLWSVDHYQQSSINSIGELGTHALSSSCGGSFVNGNLHSLTNGNIHALGNGSMINGSIQSLANGNFVNGTIQSLHSLSSRNVQSPLTSMVNVNNIIKTNGLSSHSIFTEPWSNPRHDYNSLNSASTY